MRCQQCGGIGTLAVLAFPFLGPRMIIERELPCPSCNGSGQQSCCEGATGLACDVTNTGSSGPPAVSVQIPDNKSALKPLS
jgi:hypothetical protein